MKELLERNKEEILSLPADGIINALTPEEVVHIAKVLNAFWTYNYAAADAGRPGMHAILKSGLHSDGFFVSRILLEPDNINRIMAFQIYKKLVDWTMPFTDFVIGIPDGATKLGEEVAKLLKIPLAKMEKIDGRLTLITPIPPHRRILLVEDFCTRGTGLTEAVLEILRQQPTAKFVMYDPVIINRGGLKEVVVGGVGTFLVLPVVENRINDWKPEECPLCKRGSTPIKPKATDENWQLITASQQEQS